MSPVKNSCFIPAVLGLLLGCSACDPGQGGSSGRPGIGEQHVAALPDTPGFMSEETALGIARQALTFDRLDSTSWHPVHDDRTAAPDGRRDEFLARNIANPNRGVITFTNQAGTRFVSVELQSNLLFFKCSLSK